MKDEFIYNLMKTIENHPEWAGDAIKAISQGITNVGDTINEEKNQIDMILKSISNEEKQRLINKGLKFTLLK